MINLLSLEMSRFLKVKVINHQKPCACIFLEILHHFILNVLPLRQTDIICHQLHHAHLVQILLVKVDLISLQQRILFPLAPTHLAYPVSSIPVPVQSNLVPQFPSSFKRKSQKVNIKELVTFFRQRNIADRDLNLICCPLLYFFPQLYIEMSLRLQGTML